MNMDNNMVIGGGIPNIGGPKIDPRDYQTVKCHKCGGIVFINGVILKEIPGAVVGNGTKPVIVPQPVLVCNKCGTILKDDIDAYKLEKDLEDQTEVITDAPVHVENNSGSIIIS